MTRPPGRPRNPDVIERDNTIYQLIAAGHHTRAALATATGLDRLLVQLACQRLRKAGRIHQCLTNGSITWTTADTPCP